MNVFLELPCSFLWLNGCWQFDLWFLYLSKPNLYICKFSSHILSRPSLKNFEHNLCCCSVVQARLTLHNLMNYSTQASLSFPIFQGLLRPMSIELMMPYNHLILCHPLLLLPSTFPSIRFFCNESVLLISCPKYWGFSFSISPSNEYSGLISFRIYYLISLQSKGLSRVFFSTMVQKHQFFSALFPLWFNSHICTWLLEKP